MMLNNILLNVALASGPKTGRLGQMTYEVEGPAQRDSRHWLDDSHAVLEKTVCEYQYEARPWQIAVAQKVLGVPVDLFNADSGCKPQDYCRWSTAFDRHSQHEIALRNRQARICAQIDSYLGIGPDDLAKAEAEFPDVKTDYGQILRHQKRAARIKRLLCLVDPCPKASRTSYRFVRHLNNSVAVPA